MSAIYPKGFTPRMKCLYDLIMSEIDISKTHKKYIFQGKPSTLKIIGLSIKDAIDAAHEKECKNFSHRWENLSQKERNLLTRSISEKCNELHGDRVLTILED